MENVIITSLVRYAEADCIARVLTQENGRLSVFCRGAFKASKKRGSVLQAPARARAMLKTKSTGMPSLSELDIGGYTHALGASLRGFALASFACELIEVFVPEQDPVPAVFELLDEFLRQTTAAEIVTAQIREFEFQLLELCGLLGESEALETDPSKMAVIFVRHLKQHKQRPLKTLAFFKQIGTKSA